MSAIGNDYAYEEIFARQIAALGKPGDVAVALQVAILAFGILGLVVLAVRRRFEALLLGGLILGLTIFSGVVLAAPRRNLALMPLVMTLASTGIVTVAVYVRAVLVESAGADSLASSLREHRGGVGS